MMPRPATRTLTIANGGTTSNAVSIRRYTTFALKIPVTLTGATVTFTGSDTENGTYVAITDSDAAAVSLSGAAGIKGFSALEADAMAGNFWIKAVSASAEGAERVLTLMCK